MMKKISIWLLCLALVASLAACSSSEDTETTASETEEATEATAETEETAGEETSGETEVSEYNAADYVTLGAYTGFEVDKVITEVTEDDVEEEIEIEMDENATETDVEEAEDSDYLDIDYQVLVEGESVDIENYGETIEGGSEEGRAIMLGFAELGAELDEALLGAAAGDTLSVDVTLDADSFGEDLDGVEATIEVTVNRVYRYVTPDLTDEYVQEYTDYDTVEEYRTAVQESLEVSTEESNLYEAGELALSLAVAEAVFSGYPEDLYESIYEEYDELYTYYAEMFGMERTDLISDEDLAATAENEVYTLLVIQVIAETEGLELTDEDYQEYIDENLDDYGVESEEELYEYYEEDDLRAEALREKICEYILNNSTLVEISQEEYDAKYYGEEEEGEDVEEESLEEYDEE
ncbi:MAG: hypothetical protein LUE63_01675 [Lachnospiraceae bacterium]|nr:hypothetical protein [Lachnospiraceae bacterium]